MINNFEAMDDWEEPEPTEPCTVGGWGGHEWILSIEEGQPGLTIAGAPCLACMLALDSYELDMREMPGIPVTLSTRVEEGGWPPEVSCVVLDITPRPSLIRIQGEVAEWTKKFRPTPDAPHNPLADALAVAEEAGEVCRAVLKRSHGNRPDTDWNKNLREEAADVVITLLSLAANEGWSLSDAVAERWEEVRAR